MIADVIGYKVADYIDKHDIKAKDLAKECGMSNASLSSCLSGRYETNFEFIVQLVKKVTPEDKSLLKEYCLEVKKPRNLRLAMEYAEYHEYYDVLTELIEKQKKNSKLNKDNEDCVNLYSLILDLKDEHETMYNKLNELRINTYEMKVLKEIYVLRSQYFLKNFNFFSKMQFEEISSLISEVSNSFVKEYFCSRINEFYGWIKMHLNEVVDARVCFEKIIELGIEQEAVAHAFHGLGLTYLYDSFERSMNCLKKSRIVFEELSIQAQINNVSRSINFVSCYWGKLDEYIELNNTIKEDLHEKAMIEKIKGNIKKSNDIIGGIDVSCENENKKAFHYFYRGVINKRKEDLYNSILFFRKTNDKFYSKLPCLELLKLGESPLAVNAMYGDYLLKEVI